MNQHKIQQRLSGNNIRETTNQSKGDGIIGEALGEMCSKIRKIAETQNEKTPEAKAKEQHGGLVISSCQNFIMNVEVPICLRKFEDDSGGCFGDLWRY